MLSLNERYIVDDQGERVGVLLDITTYRRLLDALEELDAIRAYDEAKAAGDDVVPFEQAVAEIERRGSRTRRNCGPHRSSPRCLLVNGDA